MMFQNLLKKLRYDPYRFVRSSPFIQIGDSRLSKSFQIDFRASRSGLSFEAGNNCILMCQAIFESETGFIKIGDGVFINDGTKLISRSGIEIENGVTIAWGCTLYDHDSHSLDYRERIKDQERQLVDWDHGNFTVNKDWSVVRSAPIRICRYAWIGFDVVILKGVTIGEGAIIAARSVVTSNIPPWTVAAGSPARVVKEVPPELRAQRNPEQ